MTNPKKKYPIPKGNMGKIFDQRFFEALEGNR
jgi:hypothetical protein